MSWSYDVSTQAGQVRLLITDIRADNPYFQNEEIDAFISIEGSTRLAAALALETIASNEALIQKVFKTLDVETDGAKLSDALIKRAEMLRKQDQMDFAGQADFAIAEQVNNDFQYRERIWKQMKRNVI